MENKALALPSRGCRNRRTTYQLVLWFKRGRTLIPREAAKNAKQLTQRRDSVGRAILEHLVQHRGVEDALTPCVQPRYGCLRESRLDCLRQSAEEKGVRSLKWLYTSGHSSRSGVHTCLANDVSFCQVCRSMSFKKERTKGVRSGGQKGSDPNGTEISPSP